MTVKFQASFQHNAESKVSFAGLCLLSLGFVPRKDKTVRTLKETGVCDLCMLIHACKYACMPAYWDLGPHEWKKITSNAQWIKIGTNNL